MRRGTARRLGSTHPSQARQRGDARAFRTSSFTARASPARRSAARRSRRRRRPNRCSPSSPAASRRGSRPSRSRMASASDPTATCGWPRRGRCRTDREGHSGGRGDGVHGRCDAGFERRPRADGRCRGPRRQLWVTEFTNAGGIVRITPGGASDRVSASTVNRTRRGSRSGPTAICGSSSRPIRGGSRRSRRGRGQHRRARGGHPDSRPTAFRARSRRAGRQPLVHRVRQPGRIGRITPAGVVTEFTAGVTPADSEPCGYHRRARRQPVVHRVRDGGRIGAHHAGRAS